MNMREYIEENHPDLLLMDGHDNAILGVGGAFNQAAVIYDGDIIIQNLESMGMSNSEAHEYFGFNIAGAYVGEHTPIIVHDKGWPEKNSH